MMQGIVKLSFSPHRTLALDNKRAFKSTQVFSIIKFHVCNRWKLLWGPRHFAICTFIFVKSLAIRQAFSARHEYAPSPSPFIPDIIVFHIVVKFQWIIWKVGTPLLFPFFWHKLIHIFHRSQLGQRAWREQAIMRIETGTCHQLSQGTLLLWGLKKLCREPKLSLSWGWKKSIYDLKFLK